MSGHDLQLRHERVCPGHQLIETGLGVAVDDAGNDVGEIAVRFNADQLAGFDQRGDDRPVLGTAIRAGEQSVLAIERQRADSSLDDVIIDFDAAVVEEERKPRPARQRVADRLGERALAADLRQRAVEEALQRVELGNGAANATDASKSCCRRLSAAGRGLRPAPRYRASNTTQRKRCF